MSKQHARRAKQSFQLAVVLVSGTLVSAARIAVAGDYNWNSNLGGNWSTTSASGWNTSPGDYPHLAGDVAVLNRELTGNQTITLDADAALGQLTFGDLTLSNNAWSISTSTSKTLTLANGSSDAVLNLWNVGSATSTISSAISLSSKLVINTHNKGLSNGLVALNPGTGLSFSGNANTVTVNGVSNLSFGSTGLGLSGLAGIYFNSSGNLDVNRSISSSGPLTLSQGLLNTGSSGFVVGGTGTTLNIASNPLSVVAKGGSTVSLNQAITAGDLNITGDGLQAKYYASNNQQGSPSSRNQVSLGSSTANSFSGNTSVSGALLTLSGTTARINSAGTLTVSGATLEADDVSGAASSHMVASTTVNVGESNFVARRNDTQNITLNLGAITRNSGGVAVFRYADTPGTIGANASITTSSAATNGILGGWAVLATNGTNADDFAGINGGVISAPTYTTLAAAGGTGGTQNFNYNSGSSLTLTGAVQGNSLRIISSANSGTMTIDTAANNVSLTSGGILAAFTGNSGPTLKIKGTGTISGASVDNDLYFHIRNSRVVVDNPLIGSGTGQVYKTGFGKLTLTADAPYGGGATVTGGVLDVSQNANALSSGNLRLTNGGQLGASGTFTRSIGTGAGQVQFGVGGGGFSAEGAPLTVNLGGAGATLTRSDIGRNLALNNTFSSTHPITLVNPIDVTGDVTVSVGANVAPGLGRLQSNNGTAYAVLQGGTTGTGALQVYGNSSSGGNPNDGGHAGAGMLVPQGGLHHTGDVVVSGANLYMGDFSALAGRNTLLTAGGQLAGFGTLTANQGVGAGEIQIKGATFTIGGGFAAVGGPLTVNVGGAGAALNGADGLALGNAFSTDTLTYQNDINTNMKVAGPVPVVVTGRVTKTDLTVGNNSASAGVLVANISNAFSGNVSVTGSVYRAGTTTAYGSSGGTNGGGGTHDLNGKDFSSENYQFNGNGNGPGGLPRLMNSNTSAPATMGNYVAADLYGGGVYFGGAGDLSMNSISYGAITSGGTVAWRGTGNFTIKGSVSGTSLGGINQSYGMSFTGGGLVLDYATDTGNKLFAGYTGTGNPAFSLTQSKMELKGNASAAVTQSIAAAGGTASALYTNLNGGAIGVKATTRGQDLTLNLNTIGRNNSAAVDFSTDASAGGVAKVTTDTLNNNYGMLGGWATWGKSDWAVNTTNAADGAIGAFAAYNNKADVATWAANDNVTNSAGYSGTLGADTNVGSLRVNASAASAINLGGKTLRIGDTATSPTGSVGGQVGGILVTSAVGANTTSITNGNLRAPDSNDLVIHQYNTAGDLQIGAVITSNGNSSAQLIKTGDGKLVLTGTNSFYGPTRVYGGTVEFNALGNHDINQPLGRSADIYAQGGATLRYTGGNASTTKRILVGVGGATIDASGAGTMTLGIPQNKAGIGGYNYDASIVRQSDTDLPDVTLTGSGNAVVSGSIILTTPWDATYDPGQSLVDETLAGVTKNGSGTWTLNSTNYWQGGTTINQGTLALGHATDTLSNNAPVTVNNGGTLSIAAGKSDYIGQLRLKGGTVGGGGTLTPMAVLAESGSIAASIDGLLTRLDKTSSGMLSITGANTFANGTFVQGGTLLVGNISGSATGSGKVDVLSGATLGGNGRITGPVNIMAGGHLSPGNSPGTLTLADVTLNGSLLMDVSDVTSDRLVVTGGLVLGDASNLDLVLNSDPSTLGQLVLIDMQGTSPISGSFATVNGAPVSEQNTFTASYGGKEYQFSMSYTAGDGNDLAIAVPEPSIMAMATSTLLGALGLRRRSR